MKNSFTKKLKMCVVLLAVMTTNVWAQLNGAYTIDATQPTAGTTFQTFSAFAATINAQGVSGPVTVNVAIGTGPYVEQVTFNQITGMSVTNTVTINGNGCTITFAGTAGAPHTWMYNGTDYFTVNNLNMVGTNITNAMVCHLYANADFNKFVNCTFTSPANSTGVNSTPVSISGSPNAVQSAAAGGSGNAWTTCSITSGYANVSFYTSTSAPINTLNVVRNCYLNDGYLAGIYCYYQNDDIFANNIIEHTNRTTFTTYYGIYIAGICLRTQIDGNHIRKIFNANQSATNTMAGIYSTCTGVTGGNENRMMNNIISDIKSAGQIFGIYLPSASYTGNFIYNNTISLDDQSTGTGSATYGVYLLGGPNMVKNNIITISRTGTGTKYGIFASTTTTLTGMINRNVILMNAPGGVNNTGYWNNQAFLTLANWQTAAGGAYDQQGSNANPNYLNAAAMNYSPTNIAINNIAEPLGLVNDFNLATRSLPSPDPGAIEFFNTPCFGIPLANSVITPTFVYCPNTTVNINVANTYSNSGYSYQWQSSTSTPLGPWTAIPGGTLATLTTPGNANVTTYYSVIISCGTGGSITAVSGTVNMAVTTTSTVPYYESFESLAPNRLPNCSWSVSNAASAVTQTVSGPNGSIPLTGTNFARFNVGGTNSFYTNGIYLNAGITYSASLWWLTEAIGYANWTQLSILVGPNQSAVNQQTIVSTPGAAISPIHKLLSGTFQVATSGLYYVQVRATSVSGSAPFLSWDDLRIDIPCDLNGPTMTLNANSFTQCDGQPFNINAMGADSYTWSNGQSGAYASITPNIANPVIYVTGTKTLSGCPATKAVTLTVNPSPLVFANAFPTEVCAGSAVNLSANGNAISYNWSNGAQGQATVVYPTTSGSYSVYGTNSFGCASMASMMINVNPLPNIIAQASQTNICVGDGLQLVGTNGVTYQWLSNTAISYIGNPLNINPTASSIFTLTGTDDKGCSNKTTFIISVDICSGLKQNGGQVSGIKLYPNPNNGSFTIESAIEGEKTMDVTDISGRVILSGVIKGEKTEVNITTLANGIYYVKLQSEGSVEIIKVVKNN